MQALPRLRKGDTCRCNQARWRVSARSRSRHHTYTKRTSRVEEGEDEYLFYLAREQSVNRDHYQKSSKKWREESVALFSSRRLSLTGVPFRSPCSRDAIEASLAKNEPVFGLAQVLPASPRLQPKMRCQAWQLLRGRLLSFFFAPYMPKARPLVPPPLESLSASFFAPSTASARASPVSFAKDDPPALCSGRAFRPRSEDWFFSARDGQKKAFFSQTCEMRLFSARNS